MSSETNTQQRRPESVLASEADKRVSTANGRPETRESTNQTQDIRPSTKQTNEIAGNHHTSNGSANQNVPQAPHNTPRDFNVANDDRDNTVGEVLSSMVSVNAVPGDEDLFDDNILDEDEMFMTLTPEEKDEWDKMITDRERQLAACKEKHTSWAYAFTRRRMFIYTRMRKLNDCYQDRVQLFSKMADTISHVTSRRSSDSKTNTAMKKTLSEPLLESNHEKAIPKVDKSLKRNETNVEASSKHKRITGNANEKREGDGDNNNNNNTVRDRTTSNTEANSLNAPNSQPDLSSRGATPACKVEKVHVS